MRRSTSFSPTMLTSRFDETGLPKLPEAEMHIYLISATIVRPEAEIHIQNISLHGPVHETKARVKKSFPSSGGSKVAGGGARDGGQEGAGVDQLTNRSWHCAQ